jgi:hypothetical protein
MISPPRAFSAGYGGGCAGVSRTIATSLSFDKSAQWPLFLWM